MRTTWTAIAAGMFLASNAYAQSSFGNLSYTAQTGNRQEIFPLSPTSVNAASDGVPVDLNALSLAKINGAGSQAILPLSAFASQQDLVQTDQVLSSQILQNTQAISSLDQSVRRAQSHASQGIAAVSSLSVIPPNPGDRFSVTFGGGEYGSQGGGGVSFAYRPPEVQSITVFAGYARTVDTNLFKGGVSFSFQ